MKIAIISDSHDNIPNIEKFLTWAKVNKIDIIIHCGDIADPELIKDQLAKKFTGPIHLVHGNVSNRDLLIETCDEIDNVTLHGDEGYLKIENIYIAFCHYPEVAKDLAKSKKYNFVFYGHTHKPWIEEINQIVVANPGTLGGVFSKATFAVLDTKTINLELKVLETI